MVKCNTSCNHTNKCHQLKRGGVVAHSEVLFSTESWAEWETPWTVILVQRQRRFVCVWTTTFSVAPMMVFALLSADLSASLGDSATGKEKDRQVDSQKVQTDIGWLYGFRNSLCRWGCASFPVKGGIFCGRSVQAVSSWHLDQFCFLSWLTGLSKDL